MTTQHVESTPTDSDGQPPATPDRVPDAIEKDVAEQDENTLPEWARRKLTEANREAANYRTQLRDAQDKLSKAKSAEEFEAAVSELNAKIAQQEKDSARTVAGLKYQLPAALVAVLQGETAEELDAHAKTLAALLPPAAPAKTERLKGGLTPTAGQETGKYDPAKLAAEVERSSGRIF